VPTGSITGVAWKDFDGNGKRQSNETDGLSGVTIYLGQGACNSTGYDQKTTPASGLVDFQNLPAGTYCLSVNVTPTCEYWSVLTTKTAYTIHLSPGGHVEGRFGFAVLVCY
jgi:hypothetical protein